jgi:hypothetical protein
MRFVALVAVVLVGMARLAWPCLRFPNPEFTPDPSSADTTPPSAVEVTDISIVRSERYEEEGCTGRVSGTCPSVGILRLAVAATDDLTPAAALGYRVTITRGAAILRHIYDRIAEHGYVSFDFPFEADLDHDLEISAIDAAGNVGPPITIHIADRTGGCAATRPASSPAVLALVAVAFVTRRRSRLPASRSVRA